MRVASKVWNLPSKFGHARPLGSRIIRYVRDGRTGSQTDGRTDGQSNAYCPFPNGVLLWSTEVLTEGLPLLFGALVIQHCQSC